jgi:hypothetical protein
MRPPLSVTVAPQRGRAWTVIVSGSGLLLLSLYFVYATSWSAVRQRQAAGFLPVQATVLESSVVVGSASGTSGRRSHHPHVRYTFTVAGATYESTQIHFLGPAWSDREAVQAVVARYPAGAKVTAHHDPRNPSQAVLDTTPHSPPLPMVLLSLAMVAGAMGIVRHGWIKLPPGPM